MRMSKFHYSDILFSLTKAIISIDLEGGFNNSEFINTSRDEKQINLNREIEHIEIINEN